MQRITMKQKAQQSWMNAITFAEAGEWDTAREMIPTERPLNKTISNLFRIFAAVAFAEEGLPEEAIGVMEQPRREKCRLSDFVKTLGLEGTRLNYGILAVEVRR